MPKQIILASASPRRKELLKKIVKKFTIVPSKVNEVEIFAPSPVKFAKKAAMAKAKDIASRHPGSIVIGADTIVVLGKKILGKPKDRKDAISMLQSLAGKKQRVITGLAIVDLGREIFISDHEETIVKMKKVSKKDIVDYIKSFNPIDKAGAYGIQELDEVFIDRIEGDYDNVVGLPVNKLRKLLKEI
ncbi:MAG: Maf family protein [Candidatus Margulisiibacteriota bacterium]